MTIQSILQNTVASRVIIGKRKPCEQPFVLKTYWKASMMLSECMKVELILDLDHVVREASSSLANWKICT